MTSESRALWRELLPVLISAALLLAGNGLLSTMLALRGIQEGFSQTWIGLFGGSYFVGFLFASWASIHLIRRAGHIRVFAGLGACATVAILAMVTWVEAEVWLVARLIQGLAFSGITTVLESWLNGLVENKTRGRILGIYRVVDLSAVTGGQFLLPLVGIDGFTIFALVAGFYCLAMVPVTLSEVANPRVPGNIRFDIRAVWLMSPVACAGCVAVGMANSAFRSVGPAYAQQIGLDVNQVAGFMSAFIVAGAVSQFPVGWLSDRIDRRIMIMGMTVGASLASLSIVLLSGSFQNAVYVGVALFGAFALPLYSLSSAHANDHCPPGQFVTLAAGLLLFFSAGAIVGSPVSAFLMDRFGPNAFFAFICGVHFMFVLFVLYRRTRRAPVAANKRSRFVGLLRTSAALFALSQPDQNDAEETSTEGTTMRNVIAIDGPSAAGKGTIARKLAAEFGFAYLDTGGLYRATAVRLLRDGGDGSDVEAACAAAQSIQPDDLKDPMLRDETVGSIASKVAALEPVRQVLFDYQRQFALTPPGGAEGAVLDGRDIGTAVCPEAGVKLFITADVEIRARRRFEEIRGKGQAADYPTILADLQARDARDTRRAHAPLTRAEDAVLIDTGNLDIEASISAAREACVARWNGDRAG